MPRVTRARVAAGQAALYSETPLPVQQGIMDGYAQRISSHWRITRDNKASRGFENTGFACYQIAALEALMHMPKFLNWIRDHNRTDTNGNVQNPCWTHPENETGICAACAVKDLTNDYWGNHRLHPCGLPRHIRADHAAFGLIDMLAQIWIAPGQQDTEEFQTRLLRECYNSCDPLT
jgi:hypothetical protein